MQVRFVHPNEDERIIAEFSLELPIFPEPRSRYGPWRHRWLVHRGSNISRFAAAMRLVNRGCFGVELTSPNKVFHDFAADLLFVKGLQGVIEASRYSLELHVGRCFDGDEVARNVAQTVQRHFYPAESLVFRWSEEKFDPFMLPKG